MIFFREIIKVLNNGEHINIAISKKDNNEEAVISIAPAPGDKNRDKEVRPFILKGNVNDMDEQFMVEFAKARAPLEKKEGIISNAAEVAADTEKENSESKTVKGKSKASSSKETTTSKSSASYKEEEKAKTLETEQVNEGVKKCEELIAEKKFQEAVDVIKPIAEKYPKNKWAGKALIDAQKGLGKVKQASTLSLEEETDKREIAEGIAQAATFTTDLKFINAIDLLAKLDKKFPKNASIEAALFATRSAKAKHEFDADDEEVTMPAPAPRASVAESVKNAIAEEEQQDEEVMLVADEEETLEIDATASTDEDDDF